MSAAELEELSKGNAGASHTYPVTAGSLKKGSYCVIKGRACKVVEITTSKTGKHGHAKAHIVALDVFNQKKLEELCPTSHNIEAPNIKRQEYQLMDVGSEGFLSLLDEQQKPVDHFKLPEGELGQKIKAAFENGEDLNVVVLSAMGEDAVVDFKTAQSQ